MITYTLIHTYFFAHIQALKHSNIHTYPHTNTRTHMQILSDIHTCLHLTRKHRHLNRRAQDISIMCLSLYEFYLSPCVHVLSNSKVVHIFKYLFVKFFSWHSSKNTLFKRERRGGWTCHCIQKRKERWKSHK